MRKFETFFNKIADVRSNMRGRTNTLLVKSVINASTRNNRTPTVNQTIAYLRAMGKKKLAKQLETAYTTLRPLVTYQRKQDGINRTDAVDIEEFVAVYREVVMNQGRLRKYFGRQL